MVIYSSPVGFKQSQIMRIGLFIYIKNSLVVDKVNSNLAVGVNNFIISQ